MRTLIALLAVLIIIGLGLWINSIVIVLLAAVGVYRLATLAYDTATHRNVKFFWKEIFNA